MTKAEKFIQDYTNHCSNELKGGGYHEWLTPKQARRAVEIARDEMLKEFEKERDERIKNVIKQVLSESTTEKDECYSNNRVTQQEVFGWLEKRGEQNPTDEEMKTILQTEYEKGRADAIAEVQKSAWSEEDEEMYKEVLTDIIYAKNDMEAKECLGLSKRAMEAFNWFSKRYKSLRPQTTWKPSEDKFAHIVGCLVQDVVANEHMPEEEKQPTKFFVEKYYKKLREE